MDSKMNLCSLLLFPLLLSFISGTLTKGESTNIKIKSDVTCGIDEMQVDIDTRAVKVVGAHVLGLKEYPDGSCQPEPLEPIGLFRFRFSFREYYRCGTTQIRNKLTGSSTFYNRIVLELEDGTEDQVLVRCQRGNQYAALLDTNQLTNSHVNATTRIVKRDVLPAGFKEDPNLIPITEQVGKAPEPMLTMLVKKDGRRIGPRLIVEPGAPLSMEVSLDPVSKDIYGILLSQLDVTDTGTKREVLLHNGCSVDSYLFENFVTTDGDILTARFKAFKFPDTNYVLFRGTINVCLNSCQGVQCITGTGFGRRRRRDTSDMNYDYEIHTAAILQVGVTNSSETSGSDTTSSDRPRVILGSTFGPAVPTNAKQTQSVPVVPQGTIANGNGGTNGILGSFSLILTAALVALISSAPN